MGSGKEHLGFLLVSTCNRLSSFTHSLSRFTNPFFRLANSFPSD